MNVGVAKQVQDDAAHCGDQCGCWQSGHGTFLCIADGLGHGEEAQQAAQAAIDYVATHLAEPLGKIFAGCNRALRGTRGVAMGLAVVDSPGKTVTYAGIGNTRAMLVKNIHREVVSEPTFRFGGNYGIVGGGYQRLVPERQRLGAGDLVILYTDGLRELISLENYDKALREDVQRLAERILQDWYCGTNDAAVLVFRNEVT